MERLEIYQRPDNGNLKWQFDPVCQLTGSGYTPAGSPVPAVRILACRDIPRHNVKAGDFGGWIDNRLVDAVATGILSAEVFAEMLPDDGDSWVGENALLVMAATNRETNKGTAPIRVLDLPRLRGNALLRGEIEDSDKLVKSKAGLKGFAINAGGFIGDNAQVLGHALIKSDAVILDNAVIRGSRRLSKGKTLEQASGFATIIGKIGWRFSFTSEFRQEEWLLNFWEEETASGDANTNHQFQHLDDTPFRERPTLRDDHSIHPEVCWVGGEAEITGEVQVKRSVIAGSVEIGGSIWIEECEILGSVKLNTGRKRARQRNDLELEKTFINGTTMIEAQGSISRCFIGGDTKILGAEKALIDLDKCVLKSHPLQLLPKREMSAKYLVLFGRDVEQPLQSDDFDKWRKEVGQRVIKEVGLYSSAEADLVADDN